MITAREASIAMSGAWRLARFDAAGLEFFDNTVEAFWRSFYAALVVLPAYAILFALRFHGVAVTSGPVTVFVVESIAYVIAWTAFPLAMFHLSRRLGRSKLYCRYIVAYNWATVLQITLLLIVTGITQTDLLPRGLAALLTMIAMIGIMCYQWFIARSALEVTPPVAVGIVLLDLVISILLEGYANSLL